MRRSFWLKSFNSFFAVIEVYVVHFRRTEDTVISCRTEKLLKIRIGTFNSIFKCFIFKFVYNERPEEVSKNTQALQSVIDRAVECVTQMSSAGSCRRQISLRCNLLPCAQDRSGRLALPNSRKSPDKSGGYNEERCSVGACSHVNRAR